MSHTKCPRCGLVNWMTPVVCERCGAPLDSDAREESAPESARPDFPLLTLGSYGITDSTVGVGRGGRAHRHWDDECVLPAGGDPAVDILAQAGEQGILRCGK